MKVKLLGLRQPVKKLQSIKTIRTFAFLGLRESKDLVDGMANGNQPILDVPGNNIDTILGEYFLFENVNDLKLFMCQMFFTSNQGVTKRKTLLLAYDRESAQESVMEGYFDATLESVKEITGPFENGTVLIDIVT